MNRDLHDRIEIRCQVGDLDVATSDRFWPGVERPEQWQALIVDIVVRGSRVAYYLVDVHTGQRAAEPLRAEQLSEDERDDLWGGLAEIVENRRKPYFPLSDEEAEALVNSAPSTRLWRRF